MAAFSPNFRFRAGRALLAVAVTAAVTACAGEGAALPDGTPAEVVGRAPATTLAAPSAEVVIAAPRATATGTVDFLSATAALRFEPDEVPDRIELRDPVAVLDMVRGAVNVESYGGTEVRGVSTLRYEIDIDPERAMARTPPERRARVEAVVGRLRPRLMFADVFVDRFNRIRRVAIPVDHRATRPRGRDRRIVAMITADFVSFGGS